MMRTVQSSWESFYERVMPEDASERQVQAMEAVFYAGAHSMLHTMLELVEDESLSEEAMTQIIDGLCQETQAFGSREG